MAGRRKQTKKKTSLVQTAGGDPLRFQLLEPASVLKPSCAAASQTQSSLEEEGGVAGGWLGEGTGQDGCR